MVALMDVVSGATSKVWPSITKGFDSLALDQSARLRTYRLAMIRREADRRPMQDLAEVFERGATSMEQLSNPRRD